MLSVRLNNVSLKYQRFTTLSFIDIRIRKSEFVAKNQLFFFNKILYFICILGGPDIFPLKGNIFIFVLENFGIGRQLLDSSYDFK